MNKKEEKQLFEKVLNLPYMTDSIHPESSCDEQIVLEHITFGKIFSKLWLTFSQPLVGLVHIARNSVCEHLVTCESPDRAMESK